MYKPDQLRTTTQHITTIFHTGTVYTIEEVKTGKELLRTTSMNEMENWLQANLMLEGQTAKPNVLRNAVVRALLHFKRT